MIYRDENVTKTSTISFANYTFFFYMIGPNHVKVSKITALPSNDACRKSSDAELPMNGCRKYLSVSTDVQFGGLRSLAGLCVKIIHVWGERRSQWLGAASRVTSSSLSDLAFSHFIYSFPVVMLPVHLGCHMKSLWLTPP